MLALVVLLGCLNQTRTKSISSTEEKVCVRSHDELQYYTVGEYHQGIQVPVERSRYATVCDEWRVVCKDGFAPTEDGEACRPVCSNDGDCYETRRCLDGACHYEFDKSCEKNSDCSPEYYCELTVEETYGTDECMTPGRCASRAPLGCEPESVEWGIRQKEVVGCDGKHYSKCGAASAGVTIAEDFVGCGKHSDCMDGHFCDFFCIPGEIRMLSP